MRKVIFGSALIVGGLLLVLIMLYIGENPNAIGGLNSLGQLFAVGGIVISLIGLVFCLANLDDK